MKVKNDVFCIMLQHCQTNESLPKLQRSGAASSNPLAFFGVRNFLFEQELD